MAKKYKQEVEEEKPVNLSINIFQYIASGAPDVLELIPVMNGDLPINFFTVIFEPEGNYEHKRQVKNSIEWSYANRIIFLARKFKALSEKGQNFVVKASSRRIWWRGDEMRQFRKIVDETINFRQLSEVEKSNYRKRVLIVASKFNERHAQ